MKTRFEAAGPSGSKSLESRGRLRGRFQNAYLNAVVAALFLMLFALWNGGPIPYPDTHEYMSRPANLLAKAAPAIFENDFSRDFSADTQPDTAAGAPAVTGASQNETDLGARLVAGRSAYWGAMAFLAYSALGFWGIIAGNALALGIAIALAWSRGLGLRFDWRYIASCAAIMLLTPAGIFTAFLTPDILTAVFILSLGLILCRWDALRPFDRGALCSLGVIATISHDSNVIVALALPLLALGLALFGRRRWRLPVVAAGILPLVAAIVGTLLLGAVARSQTGYPPERFPFLTAHLSDIPAANDAIREICRETDYELCDHVDQLDRGTWIDFLFHPAERGGVFYASPQPGRDRLNAEQLPMFADVMKARPFEIGSALVLDGFRQVFTTDLLELSPTLHHDALREKFNPDRMAAFEATRIMQRPDWFTSFSMFQQWTFLGSIVLLAFTAWRRRDLLSRDHAARRDFVILAVAGVVINGICCGILAVPLGRFQARAGFIILFIGLGVLAARRTAQRRVETGSDGQSHDDPPMIAAMRRIDMTRG